MTKRAALEAAQWGIAPLYVGQQVTGPGNKNNTSDQGTTDGRHAVDLLTAENFAAQTCAYLDLENGPPFSEAQREYVASWCDAVQAGGFTPGVYCSFLFAEQVHQLRSSAQLWVFHVPTVQPHPIPGTNFPDPHPSGSGYTGASIWQLAQNGQITVPPAQLGSLTIDLDSAISANPGAP
jgi:hypothetical protein